MMPPPPTPAPAGRAARCGSARPRRTLLLDQDAGGDAADVVHRLDHLGGIGGASIAIGPPGSLRSSVPCTPEATSLSGANSRSASATRRPVRIASARRGRAPRRRAAGPARRHAHRIRRGRHAEQRAVDVEEQRPLLAGLASTAPARPIALTPIPVIARRLFAENSGISLVSSSSATICAPRACP